MKVTNITNNSYLKFKFYRPTVTYRLKEILVKFKNELFIGTIK